MKFLGCPTGPIPPDLPPDSAPEVKITRGPWARGPYLEGRVPRSTGLVAQQIFKAGGPIDSNRDEPYFHPCALPCCQEFSAKTCISSRGKIITLVSFIPKRLLLIQHSFLIEILHYLCKFFLLMCQPIAGITNHTTMGRKDSPGAALPLEDYRRKIGKLKIYYFVSPE